MKEGARMVVVGKGVCVFAGLCGAHAQRQPGVPIQEAAPAISLASFLRCPHVNLFLFRQGSSAPCLQGGAPL